MKIDTMFTRVLDLIAKVVINRKSIITKRHFDSFVEKVEFIPFLQPIFNGNSNPVIGCEVLLRVKTDEGYKSPVDYI